MNGGRTLLASLTVLLVTLFAGVYGLLELHGVAGRAAQPVVQLSELARGGGAPPGLGPGLGPGRERIMSTGVWLVSWIARRRQLRHQT